MASHALLLDHHILDILVQLELLAQCCCATGVKLVLTKVNCLDLLEDASELGDELDALINFNILQGQVEARIILLHLPEGLN